MTTHPINPTPAAGEGSMIYFLTPREKKAVQRLQELHAKFPANDYGFHASSLGASNAAACRRIETTGLVFIDRQAGNCFRYRLSEDGRRVPPLASTNPTTKGARA
jgi:hypothetical protein